MIFEKASRLKEFLERVESETDKTTLRLSQAVRCLIFQRHGFLNDDREAVDEALLNRFRNSIPYLSRLEHITWDIKLPKNLDVFEEFRAKCRRLRSVKLLGNLQLTEAGECNSNDIDDAQLIF